MKSFNGTVEKLKSSACRILMLFYGHFTSQTPINHFVYKINAFGEESNPMNFHYLLLVNSNGIREEWCVRLVSIFNNTVQLYSII